MKTALITGAASGIGKEFTKIHASKEGNIVAVDMNSEGLEKLKTEIQRQYNVSVYTIVKDLSKPTAAIEIYEEVKNKEIKVDYLINNAGFGGVGAFHERKWEIDMAMIQVNILALTALTRQFLPDFIKRKSGKILNVSSTVSLVPGPYQAVYFASKAYVTSFNRSIYGELIGTGVSSKALLPEASQTAFGNYSDINKTANLVIYDTFGKLISQIKLTSTFQKININNLESGAYYISIKPPKINTQLKNYLPSNNPLVKLQINH
ncbi:MAG: SDR family NAD(P)-dependent oxidoreductase [Flavobacteriales bacterium]|jgi:short-subunit dehydrogenase|nr:SDR family NAD(P)-dependent oxidoreductase [Flavobacteriales bacterium]